jgi:hypothetical protein
MTDQASSDNTVPDTPEPRVPARRRFLQNTAGLGLGFAGSTLVGACGGGSDNAMADTGPSDAAILNFALNLEYLEAEFYLAAVGRPRLSSTDGSGTSGGVTGGQAVQFSTPAIREYAEEIAEDEKAHVQFLRSALGSAKVARPAIDISASGPFTAAARAAGVVGPNETFNPYANENNFLLGAYLFEDVGVTAYKGASPLIDSDTFLEAAAGILAAEAYHAGIIRTTLYARGLSNSFFHEAANKISDARDSLDNSADVDQGITEGATGSGANANIVPTDANGIAFSRAPGDVLNIVYLDDGTTSNGGGFFPQGVNGTLDTSSG